MKKRVKPFTAHTGAPVSWDSGEIPAHRQQLQGHGILADVAPTILELLDVDQPKDMTGKSLIMKV
jgi:2,3-bisphosphoglycerate-independent phosphoglycerate mutase